MPPRDDDSGPDVPIRTRRRSGLPVVAVVAALLGAVVIVVLAVVAAVWLSSQTPPTGNKDGVAPPLPFVGPSEGNEGENWNHRDLQNYLAGRGLPDILKRETNVRGFWGPTVEFRLGNEMVYCQIRKSAREARDEAGSMVHAFSWGKFLFTYNEFDSEKSDKLARQIATALGAKR